MVGALRAVLEAVVNKPAAAPSTSTSLAVPAPVLDLASLLNQQSLADLGRRLTPELHRQLKTAAQSANPSEFWSASDLPCKQLVQQTLSIAHFNAFEWISWSKYLSEEAAFKKAQAITTGSPYKVAAILHTRGIAFAMVNTSAFVSWK